MLRIVSIFVLINEVINENVENIMMFTRPIPVVLIIDIGNDFFFWNDDDLDSLSMLGQERNQHRDYINTKTQNVSYSLTEKI